MESPLLPNDVRSELATLLEPNHKTKDKPQTLFCFVHQTPNQNEAKWTVSLFENVQGKSSPKWIRPKILKKVDTLYLVWETVVGSMVSNSILKCKLFLACCFVTVFLYSLTRSSSSIFGGGPDIKVKIFSANAHHVVTVRPSKNTQSIQNSTQGQGFDI